ncbi:hypothetical protein V8C43DRAFT_287379 [Trichoderma afarasin]
MSRTVASSIWLFASVFQASVSTPPSYAMRLASPPATSGPDKDWSHPGLGHVAQLTWKMANVPPQCHGPRCFRRPQIAGIDNEYPAGAQC